MPNVGTAKRPPLPKQERAPRCRRELNRRNFRNANVGRPDMAVEAAPIVYAGANLPLCFGLRHPRRKGEGDADVNDTAGHRHAALGLRAA